MLSRFLEYQHNTCVFQKGSSFSARPYASSIIVLSKNNIQAPFFLALTSTWKKVGFIPGVCAGLYTTASPIAEISINKHSTKLYNSSTPEERHIWKGRGQDLSIGKDETGQGREFGKKSFLLLKLAYHLHDLPQLFTSRKRFTTLYTGSGFNVISSSFPSSTLPSQRAITNSFSIFPP